MKFITVLVLASFTLNVFAQTLATVPQTSKSGARNTLIAAGTLATGQAYVVDGCKVPNDTGTYCMASASYETASFSKTSAPSEPTATTSTSTYEAAPSTATAAR